MNDEYFSMIFISVNFKEIFMRIIINFAAKMPRKENLMP